jgi:hypothetical protein
MAAVFGVQYAKAVLPHIGPSTSIWSSMSTPREISIDENDKPRAAARYIGALTRELARLARSDGCETLSYLLELAVIEAEIVGGVPDGQRLS